MDIFDAKNAAFVGGASLIISVLGLAGTLIGFWITLIQLKRTKTAADASSEAVGALKLRMAHYDTLTELSYAISATREARRHLDGQQWKYALDGLEEIRVLLTRIMELSSEMLSEEKDNIKATISDLSLSSQSLSKQIEKSDITIAPRIRIKLTSTLEFLSKLSVKAQRAAQ
jgi:hypothetical protein